jgi:hypothetical protein
MSLRSVLISSTLLVLPVTSLFAFGADRSAVRSAVKTSGENGRSIVADPNRDRIFPYIYDGAGWSTTFVLTNLDNRTINLRLEFTLQTTEAICRFRLSVWALTRGSTLPSP